MYTNTKGPSIKYVRKIFQKTNISNPLIRTRTCVYQEVRNVSFSENFAYGLNEWPPMNMYWSTPHPVLVKLQEWKHESNVWNLFYVNNKENRITPMKTHLSNCSGVKAISMRGVCYEQLLNVPKCLTPDSFKLINICWEFGRQIAPWCPCKLWSLPSLLIDVR